MIHEAVHNIKEARRRTTIQAMIEKSGKNVTKKNVPEAGILESVRTSCSSRNLSCSSSTVSNVFQVSSNVAGFTSHIVLIIIIIIKSSSFIIIISSLTYQYN